jgi:hypothetical protein
MPCAPFDRDDEERLAATLARFLPHTNRSAIALTGGIAIHLHCHDAGVSSGRTRIADVDFVASSVETVAPSVASTLLVSHFHLPHPGYPKFMVQVVDPETRLRIDVFPDVAVSIALAVERTVGGQSVRVLDPRSILDHKVQGMSRASAARPIDEKHSRDAMLLGSICGQRIAPLPPESIVKDVYRMDLTPCPRCEASRTPGFTVAPRQQIFEILGYN